MRTEYNQTNQTQLDRIHNTNKLNAYLNRMIPLINNRLEKGYKLKNDGSLYETDKKDIYEILNKNKPVKIQTWINSTLFRTDLQAKIHYSERYNDGSESCYTIYIQQSLFLFGTNHSKIEIGGKSLPLKKEFERIETKFQIRTVKQIEKVITVKRILKNKIETLTSELNDLKFNYNNYIK